LCALKIDETPATAKHKISQPTSASAARGRGEGANPNFVDMTALLEYDALLLPRARSPRRKSFNTIS
jgi:hypothetical protein